MNNCIPSAISGQEDPDHEEASGGSGRRVQHHCGGQTSSADASQAGGGTAERLNEPNLILFFTLFKRISVNINLPVSDRCPSVLQIDSEVCPQRILISNLPKMDTDTLLNKLEIHFSKTRNGGGEVDEIEMLSDSGTVVLAFMEKSSEQALLRL